MNTISFARIREFVKDHPTAKPSLKAWFKTTQKSAWRSLAEVKRTYPHADLVGEFTVFNVGGNNYRVITYINYQHQQVLIKAVLTHREYDKDNWKT